MQIKEVELGILEIVGCVSFSFLSLAIASCVSVGMASRNKYNMFEMYRASSESVQNPSM